MSMTRDAAHQALDINIGRILQMYLTGDLSAEVTRNNLTRFFNGAPEWRGDIDAWLTRRLNDMRDGHDANHVRHDIVRMAAAAERHDPKLAEMLHPGHEKAV
ncbi:hypothetical protein ABAC460_23765 [Asticcacaulis sp. AC460]|uniref:hypothetical protein n=1 Tax=Asticcacaulis sp. AC460 TaxID=1282360 RepID=UPI0003C3B845|nr:hypothetical protein [Asticcacaulis sp. AC460]ESQ85377.1 hypothetical protein ABAC460_23765 [Asticcacaulis sp. AC460]